MFCTLTRLLCSIKAGNEREATSNAHRRSGLPRSILQIRLLHLCHRLVQSGNIDILILYFQSLGVFLLIPSLHETHSSFSRSPLQNGTATGSTEVLPRYRYLYRHRSRVRKREDWPDPRNDSLVDSMTSRDLFRWKTLFGLSPFVAGLELLDHRTKQLARRPNQRYTPKPKTLEQWPWERCERQGFDRESYDYWLERVDEEGLMDPKGIAAWVDNRNATYELFVLSSGDVHVDRSQWASFIKREPIFHKVYDWKGRPHQAILLRD